MATKIVQFIYLFCLLIFLFVLIENVTCKKAKHTINYSSIVKTCDDNPSDFIDTSELRAKRIDENTAVLYGPLTLKQGFSTPLMLDITVYKLLPMGAKEIVATHQVEDLCEYIDLTKEENPFEKYLKAVNFTEECPVPAGEYYFDNMVADTDTLPNKASFEGKYTLKFEFIPDPVANSKKNMFGQVEKNIAACLLFDMSVDKVV